MLWLSKYLKSALCFTLRLGVLDLDNSAVFSCQDIVVNFSQT